MVYLMDNRADALVTAHKLTATGTLRNLVQAAFEMGARTVCGLPPIPELKLLEGPQVTESGSLILTILYPRKVGFEEYVPRLKLLAEQHGFDGDGKVGMSAEVRHGLDTYTRTVWFCDRHEQEA